jgi:acetylornithine deacetylase/succinyl-diaminopimelate desuccinylase-like protein
MCDRQFAELMGILSVPRPNGSKALERTVERVRAWLEGEGIPVQSHRFTLRPYLMESMGLWMALTGLLLPIAALAGWGWGGLIIALAAPVVPMLEVRFLRPTFTSLFRRPAQNLVISFLAPHPAQEVILCAHVDSKTELLDHIQRAALLRLGIPATGLALACGVLTAFAGLLPAGFPSAAFRWLAFAAGLPAAAYGLAMGANMIGGRFSRHPSTGAVDNGAAVAVLMALAQELQHGQLDLQHTSVTLLLTVGEEAQMQGALAYVRDREEWRLPSCAVNLEVLGQNGGYALWEEDGTAMLRLPTDPTLNQALERAVEAVCGEHLVRVPQVSSDGFAFLYHGIPATTLGSFDIDVGGRGLHSAQDRPDRVDVQRLGEAVDVLSHLLTKMDAETGRPRDEG